jgi:hypothetical protein
VLCLGQCGDVERGVAQGDQLAPAGQLDWIGKIVDPTTSTIRLIFHRPRLCSLELSRKSTS